MKWRLVDQIVEWSPHERIRGIKAVSFEEYCARSPLGYDERLPESMAMESLVQLANWLLMLSSDFGQCGMLAEFERAEFEGGLSRGERMSIEVRVRERDTHGMVCDGVGTCAGRRAVGIEGMLLDTRPISDCYDPADLRVLYEEMHRPVNGGAP